MENTDAKSSLGKAKISSATSTCSFLEFFDETGKDTVRMKTSVDGGLPCCSAALASRRSSLLLATFCCSAVCCSVFCCSCSSVLSCGPHFLLVFTLQLLLLLVLALLKLLFLVPQFFLLLAPPLPHSSARPPSHPCPLSRTLLCSFV